MSPVERTAAWVLNNGQYGEEEEEGEEEVRGEEKSGEEPRNPEKVRNEEESNDVPLTVCRKSPHSRRRRSPSSSVRAGDLAAEGTPAGIRPAPGGVRAATAGSGAADAEAAAGVQAASGGRRGEVKEAAGGEGWPDEKHRLQVGAGSAPLVPHGPDTQTSNLCVCVCAAG